MMHLMGYFVALCEEGVDRNKVVPQDEVRIRVALCEEGVDRNWNRTCISTRSWVALCEEGVDRNAKLHKRGLDAKRRPLRRGRG